MKKLWLMVFIISIELYSCTSKEIKKINETIVKNGLIEENNYTYYYENGIMTTGWKDINSNTYYFNKNNTNKPIGSMIKDDNQIEIEVLPDGSVDIKEYYFDNEGKMIKNNWYNKTYEENGLCYSI